MADFQNDRQPDDAAEDSIQQDAAAQNNDNDNNEVAGTIRPEPSIAIGHHSSEHCSTQRRWYRRPRNWVLLLLVLWLGYHVMAMMTPDRPVRYSRNAQGEMVPDGKNPLQIKAHAGAIQANNSMTTTSSSSVGSNARLACRHIVIMSRSDHPVIQAVGPELARQLADTLPFVEQVDYLPVGDTLERGADKPDLIYTLILGEDSVRPVRLPAEPVEKKRGLLSRFWDQVDVVPMVDRHELTIVLSGGTVPLEFNNSMLDHLTPPLVQMSMQATLDHRSTVEGISTPAAAYDLVAKNISEQLSESLVKSLQELKEKHGLLPPLPAGLEPPFMEPDATVQEIVEQLRPQPIAEMHGVMARNDSSWILTTDQQRETLFTGMIERLEAADWRIDSRPNFDPEKQVKGMRPFLRAQKGGKMIEIGELRKPDRMATGVIIVTDGPADTSSAEDDVADGSKVEPYRVGIWYRDRMDRDTDVMPVLEQYIAGQMEQNDGRLSEKALEIAQIFEHFWYGSKPIQRAVLQSLESGAEGRPLDTRRMLMLAQLLYRTGKKDQAFETLRLAATATRVLDDGNTDYLSRIKSQAKSWKQEELTKELDQSEVTEDALRELGLVEITPELEPKVVEVGFNEPVGVFGRNEQGELRTLVVRAVPIGNSSPKDISPRFPPWHLEEVETHGKGVKSWGSGGSGGRSLLLRGVGVVMIVLQPIEGSEADDPRLQATITLEKE